MTRTNPHEPGHCDHCQVSCRCLCMATNDPDEECEYFQPDPTAWDEEPTLRKFNYSSQRIPLSKRLLLLWYRIAGQLISKETNVSR